MLDVGRRGPAPLHPSLDFTALKAALPDPAAYFLGPDYESLILPDFNAEYYGFPPGKAHVFEPDPSFRVRSRGMSPLVSFAAGGLAETWTGGCYPFNDADLAAFPFDYAGLAPHYSAVAARIGITGIEDDLTRFLPFHDGLLDPLELDPHSRTLTDSYQRHRATLNSAQRFFLGRARSAVLTTDRGSRKACDRLGRCLWGCPTASFYTPSITLDECLAHPNFRYLPGQYVTHFRFDSANRITAVVSRSAAGEQTLPVSRLVLGAGALSSSFIFLNSIYRDSGEVATLPGVMDNRQVMMPFVNLRMLGRRYEPASYQYHQLALGIPGESPHDYVHGLITTLKTALIHPLVQSLPFDLRTSLAVFRQIRAGLGLVNVNFSDTRRNDNRLSLDVSASASPRLVIEYTPSPGEPARIAAATRTIRSALLRLGCIAPPWMTRLRPMGASVHYAGTLPMSEHPSRFTCTPGGRSHDFENLYLIDGAAFPSLPSKNLTLTLMANATRIAQSI